MPLWWFCLFVGGLVWRGKRRIFQSLDSWLGGTYQGQRWLWVWRGLQFVPLKTTCPGFLPSWEVPIHQVQSWQLGYWNGLRKLWPGRPSWGTPWSQLAFCQPLGLMSILISTPSWGWLSWPSERMQGQPACLKFPLCVCERRYVQLWTQRVCVLMTQQM